MFILDDFLTITKELVFSRSFRIALMLILPYAGVLVGLDVAAHYGDATGAALPAQFFMSQDRSFAEYLEYSMTISATVLMFLLWFRSRRLVFICCSLLFLYMTIDNFEEIHENVGLWIGSFFPSYDWMPIQPHHIAESAVFGLAGLVWLTGMAVALRQSDRTAAVYGFLIILCIAGAAVFGVVVDMGTTFEESIPFWRNVLAFVEDEGEFAMTIVVFAVTVAIYDREKRLALEAAAKAS